MLDSRLPYKGHLPIKGLKSILLWGQAEKPIMVLVSTFYFNECTVELVMNLSATAQVVEHIPNLNLHGTIL